MTQQICKHLDIAYTEDPLQTFDLYVPTPPSPSPSPWLVCFVHGRDWNAGDKGYYASLAPRIITDCAPHFPIAVAVPNYRLTTSTNHLKHPSHAQDILQFLLFVRQWSDPSCGGTPYDPDHIILIAHDCSAHMLSSIFLKPPFPTVLTAPDTLLSAIRGLILSQGLYDLDMLINDLPQRTLAVQGAFGDLDSYSQFNVTSYTLHPNSNALRWFILHDESDTSVNLPQSSNMVSNLKTLYPLQANAVSLCTYTSSAETPFTAEPSPPETPFTAAPSRDSGSPQDRALKDMILNVIWNIHP